MNLQGMKIVRTDMELECPIIDATLTEKGAELVLLPEGVAEEELAAHVADADLLLMCYTPVTAKVIEAVDLHFKLGLGQFLEKRYTSIETFAA